jgi:hypothetical protein
MKRFAAAIAIALLASLLAATAALADEWLVTKLRGTALQLVDGQWSTLQRGDLVDDDRTVRTMKNGRAQLVRGSEVIDLGPDTQVQIHDQTGKRYTTVQQYFGDVTVDAEVQNVQHFEVQTPFVAAVVKGTHFQVTSDGDGSRVKVTRGHVQVDDLLNHGSTLISAGQQAQAGVGQPLSVTGKPSTTTTNIVTRNGVVTDPVSPDDAQLGGMIDNGVSPDSFGLLGGIVGGTGGNSLLGIDIDGGNGGLGVNVDVGGDNGLGLDVNAGGGGGLDTNLSLGGSGGMNGSVSLGGGSGLDTSLSVGGDNGVGANVNAGGDNGLGVNVNVGGTNLGVHVGGGGNGLLGLGH